GRAPPTAPPRRRPPPHARAPCRGRRRRRARRPAARPARAAARRRPARAGRGGESPCYSAPLHAIMPRKRRRDVALKLRKVQYEKKEHIAYVTIDNAKHENCLEEQVDQELWAVWRDVRDDPKLYVAILTGAGTRSFCAGADLRYYVEMMSKRSPEGNRRRAHGGPNLGGSTARARAPGARPSARGSPRRSASSPSRRCAPTRRRASAAWASRSRRACRWRTRSGTRTSGCRTP